MGRKKSENVDTEEKKTVKKTRTKKSASAVKKEKPKKEKKVVEYSEFIRTVQKDIIMSHIEEIENICKTYEGIDEAPLEVWKRLNEIVIEVCDAAEKNDYTGGFRSYDRKRPTKRAQYGISQRVREMERKRYILNNIAHLRENEGMEEHFCNLIYGHIYIWTTENAKVEKEKPKKSDD